MGRPCRPAGADASRQGAPSYPGCRRAARRTARQSFLWLSPSIGRLKTSLPSEEHAGIPTLLRMGSQGCPRNTGFFPLSSGRACPATLEGLRPPCAGSCRYRPDTMSRGRKRLGEVSSGMRGPVNVQPATLRQAHRSGTRAAHGPPGPTLGKNHRTAPRPGRGISSRSEAAVFTAPPCRGKSGHRRPWRTGPSCPRGSRTRRGARRRRECGRGWPRQARAGGRGSG